jgi:hypothetical protein
MITHIDQETVTHLQNVANTLRDDAVRLAAEMVSTGQPGVSLEKLLQRRDFLSRMTYSLAREVARILAENDRHVESVYLYEPSANPDSEAGIELPVEATLHLLVSVTAPTAALESFIRALDRALTDSLRELPSPLYAGRTSILNVCLVTGEDIRERRGYAALLTSVFAPPLKIWDRPA